MLAFKMVAVLLRARLKFRRQTTILKENFVENTIAKTKATLVKHLTDFWLNFKFLLQFSENSPLSLSLGWRKQSKTTRGSKHIRCELPTAKTENCPGQSRVRHSMCPRVSWSGSVPFAWWSGHARGNPASPDQQANGTNHDHDTPGHLSGLWSPDPWHSWKLLSFSCGLFFLPILLAAHIRTRIMDWK